MVFLQVCDNLSHDISSTNSWTGSFLPNRSGSLKRSLIEPQDYLSSVYVLSRFPGESVYIYIIYI